MLTDQDFLTITLVLLVIVITLLLPPGPGTPLRDRVQQPDAAAA